MTDEPVNQHQVRSMVRDFYAKHGLPVRTSAGLVFDPGEVEQMRALLAEEVGELYSAIDRGDLLKIVDGLADVVYVIYGMSLQYGVDLDRAIAAVHHSNMTKEDSVGPWATGTPRKVARGDDYMPPDLGIAMDGNERA